MNFIGLCFSALYLTSNSHLATLSAFSHNGTISGAIKKIICASVSAEFSTNSTHSRNRTSNTSRSSRDVEFRWKWKLLHTRLKPDHISTTLLKWINSSAGNSLTRRVSASDLQLSVKLTHIACRWEEPRTNVCFLREPWAIKSFTSLASRKNPRPRCANVAIRFRGRSLWFIGHWNAREQWNSSLLSKEKLIFKMVLWFVLQTQTKCSVFPESCFFSSIYLNQYKLNIIEVFRLSR